MRLTKRQRIRLRELLFAKQGGRCCYCEKGIFLLGVESRANAAVRLDVGSVAELNQRVATLEHLRRRADGGTDHRDNLGLSCTLCNSSRGERSWLEWKSFVMDEMAA